ncbi:MAG TPA: hypothetical protein VGY66_03190 [Gemmataceae bacterium]|nr:hypothetical protein [Gemmataceae bacterium]
MPKPIDLDQLLADNLGVDAEKLKKWLEEMQRLQLPVPSRYRYNLVSPFAGRLYRHPAAEVGGPNDNVRKDS